MAAECDPSRRRLLTGAALGAGLVLTSQLPFANRAAADDVPVYLDPNAPLEERVEAILALMSDSQKLSCFTGIPAMTLADGYELSAITTRGVEGLHGSGQNANATMFPQAIGLGSTWDAELLEQVGHVVGFETRSKNADALRVFGPVTDIGSNPLAGRFEESYGEDPFLCGSLGTAYAFGIKGRHPFYILAKPELKHLLGYAHEWNRARSSSSMSCRALHEFNVVAYKMPIAAGAVLGAMTSYNLINGVPSIIHPLMQVVRDEWAPGNFMFVPDGWDEYNLYKTKGAPYVYPLVPPANADVSYPAGLSPNPSDDTTNRYTTGALLLRAGMTSFADFNGAGFNGTAAAQGAVANGILGVSMREVDRVIRDWLAYKLRTGALDGSANPYNSTVIPPNPTPQSLQSSKDLALLAAQEQFVLLKNENDLLPLDPSRVRKLALLGPLGDVNLRDYYSPKPPDSARVTPLQGIVERLGAGNVVFHNGTDTVAWESVAYDTFVTAAGGTAQLTAGYTADATPIEDGYRLADGRYVTKSQAFQVYDWGYDQNFFRSMATGNYVNSDQAVVNSATQVRCSQVTMIDSNTWNINVNWHYPRNGDGTRSIYGVNYIQDDQFYRRFTTGRYVQAGPGGDHPLAPALTYADFQSGSPETQAGAKFHEHLIENGADRAAALAAEAGYAVVVIGNNVLVNARESQDRPGLALAPQQARLVRAVAAARPGKTIVVIVSSYPLAVQDIQNDPNVAAILYSSHAGQAAGTALASVLFGDYSPAGRLSATWLVDESSLPRLGPDADGHDEHYTVDMLEYDQLAARLTYRYSEAEHVYPFGYGLSYTGFTYRDLSVPRRVRADQTFDVTFEVTNTGRRRTSDEVAQVYLHSRDSAYGTNVARKQLVGFRRVKAIVPGETRRVNITVDPQDMFVWDAVRQDTIVETGRYDLMVGASSEDIRLSTVVRIKGRTIGALDLTTRRNAWEYSTDSHGVSHWEVSKANTLARNGGYHSVCSRRDGDYIGFTKVTLDGINGIELSVATTNAGWADVRRPVVDVRLDDPNGPHLGKLSFAPTGGLQDFTTVRAVLHDIPRAPRPRDLYLVFRTGGIYLDSIQLLRRRPR